MLVFSHAPATTGFTFFRPLSYFLSPLCTNLPGGRTSSGDGRYSDSCRTSFGPSPLSLTPCDSATFPGTVLGLWGAFFLTLGFSWNGAVFCYRGRGISGLSVLCADSFPAMANSRGDSSDRSLGRFSSALSYLFCPPALNLFSFSL
jgi:hypothetical protein